MGIIERNMNEIWGKKVRNKRKFIVVFISFMVAVGYVKQ